MRRAVQRSGPIGTGPTRGPPRGYRRGEARPVNLAICHPVVVPARGGCETYIADLLRRLDADGHEVHLYASQWDPAALPGSVRVHSVAEKGWPRFLRPWRFSQACREAISHARHDVT